MTRFTSLSRMPLAVIYGNRDSSLVAFGPISGKEGDEGGESEWGDERGGTFFSVLGHSSRGGFRGGEEGVGGMRKRGEMED